MPPRPKSAPKLPEWLASRVSSRVPQFLPAPIFPVPGGRYVPPPRSSTVPPNQVGASTTLFRPSTSNSSFRNSSPTDLSAPSVPASNPEVNFPNPLIEAPTDTSSPSGPEQDKGASDNDQSDLEDLPPPPPPPNILPPSPPPEILPSLDE